MQHTKKPLTSLLQLVTCAVLALGATAQVKAADSATGTWNWTQPGRNGGADRKSTLKLKQDGEKLTGTVTAPGRGGETADTEISDGKIKGDEVSFNVVREFNGNKFTAKYNGKLSGDSIKGKIETERNGTPNSRDWEAKRDK